MMLTDAELAGMRHTSTCALDATCTITRAGTDRSFDAETGTYTGPDPENIHTGLACRVRPAGAAGDTVIGDLGDIEGRYIATVAHDTDDLRVDDILTVTAGTDPELVGRALRIVDLRWSEQLIDRRLIVEDLQRTRPT